MPDCASIDPLVTPYVDGGLGASERRLVDAHVRVCAPCHSRLAAERAISELMRARRAELAACTASATLRERCAALRTLSAGVAAGAGAAKAWQKRLAPLAVAAGLVTAAGAVSVYVMTARSTRLLAAELMTDHVKCFGMEPIWHPTADPAEAERRMASIGWHMPLPEAAAAGGMELIGARVCLYGRGFAAHLMYRRKGQPVSVFMIPEMSRGRSAVNVMGHEAAIWSRDGRTFVLVAREPEDRAVAAADLSRMTAVVQAALR